MLESRGSLTRSEAPTRRAPPPTASEQPLLYLAQFSDFTTARAWELSRVFFKKQSRTVDLSGQTAILDSEILISAPVQPSEMGCKERGNGKGAERGNEQFQSSTRSQSYQFALSIFPLSLFSSLTTHAVTSSG